MSDLHDSSRPERPERLLRFAEVRARIGLSRSEIYRRIGAGTFPAGVKLGARAVAWRESAIEDWIRALR
ncbi:AlpA family phage regulatory protein [Burkholderia cenocepacia]|uniref:helix-turn-helix transcriptional regulator n=1 Tax=Burkholderia cenocepacia TaxID=95486 RepID=UPI00285E3A18|nr:AlpA family phage regulatory protein [Burkholderia cenocepacia]MDR8079503.1 AlpA family phage regulatory protein [Burkholderia cenocepacia]